LFAQNKKAAKEQRGSPMPTITIEYRDERYRIALEQAIASLTELHQFAQDAPRSSVLDDFENLALSDGRAE
jgi:hypothetical protein